MSVFSNADFQPRLGKIWPRGGFVRKYGQNSPRLKSEKSRKSQQKNGVSPCATPTATPTPTPTMVICTTPRLKMAKIPMSKKVPRCISRGRGYLTSFRLSRNSGFAAVSWREKALTPQPRNRFPRAPRISNQFQMPYTTNSKLPKFRIGRIGHLKRNSRKRNDTAASATKQPQAQRYGGFVWKLRR